MVEQQQQQQQQPDKIEKKRNLPGNPGKLHHLFKYFLLPLIVKYNLMFLFDPTSGV